MLIDEEKPTRRPRMTEPARDVRSLLEKYYSIKNIKDLMEKLDEVYIVYGSPFITVCGYCRRNFYVCLLVRRTPMDVEEFDDEPLGVLVFVSNKYELDENIELLMRKSKVVRSYGPGTGFYIPLDDMGIVLKRLCRDARIENVEINALKYEEALVYLD